MSELDSGTKEALIRLLGRTARAADEADHLNGALTVAIGEIARFAGWPVGHAYLPANDGSGELVSSGIWHLDDEKRFRAFRELTEATRFAPGVGLPGRVLGDKKPCWVYDLAADHNFPRAHQGVEIGLRAGFAVPVLVDGAVAAVMEFFAPEPVAADSYLLTLMEEVGKRLGLAFAGRRALEKVRQHALITDQVREAVVIADFAGKVVDCNTSAETFFGYTREELLAMPVSGLVADPVKWDSRRAGILREIERQGRWEGILRAKRKDGAQPTMELSLTAYHGAGGRHTATLGVCRDVTEREAATRALEQQALALEQLVEAVFVTDAAGRIIECNPATEVMYGLSREALIGTDGADLAADPDAWRELRRQMYPVLEKAGKYTGTVEFRRGDGEIRTSEFSLAALRNEQGERIAQVCIGRDVTEQNRILADLLQQARIIEQLSEAVLVVGRDGRIIDCNPALARLTGYEQSELVAMSTWDLMPDPETPAGKNAAVYLGLAGKGHWTGLSDVRRKDGEVRVCELSMTRLEESSDPETSHITLVRDVTDHIDSEKTMRQQALIMEQLTEAVLVTSPEGSVIDCNPAAEKLFGHTRDELIGMEAAELHAVPEEWREERIAVGDQLDRKIDWQSETPFRRQDGSKGFCEASISPLLDDSGKRIANVCFVHDITERKELESQLLQAQKMKAVGQLTGGVAHDFNNLLTAILGNLEMLEERTGDDPKTRRLIATAIDATLKGANLTQQLLAFSRKQPLQPRRIALAELLPRMRNLMGRTLGATIEIEIALPGEELFVCADPAQLESAILNLGINARDAMPEGGDLRIKASLAEPRHLPGELLAAAPERRFIGIEVADTGAGMAPRVLERAFEPFFTTKDVGDGSGLGLSMVYGFAKQSGGHVGIVSKPGRGTRVTLLLPQAGLGTERAEESRSSYTSADHQAGARVVLVVEDDKAVCDYASNALESLGYSVITAMDGKEALARMKAEGRIDLLFTDVVLPGGMDGGRLADYFRDAWPEGRVLFTSGYTRQAIESEGRLGPDQRLLAKPYRRHELIAALEDAIPD